MKHFKYICAQGDLYIVRISGLPGGLLIIEPEKGKVICGHSETGHHHVMDAEKVEMYRLPEEIYECFIVVKEPTALEHLRSFDTHEPIMFEPGTYRVLRQREYTPESFRRVED